LGLIELTVVEQRYRAVLTVQSGVPVVEVAAEVGVSRQTLHTWLRRYRSEGLAGLADRSHRPEWCPHQVGPEVEALVCELRRSHPRWGPKRLAFELDRRFEVVVPSEATVYRILVRHGLIDPKARRRKRSDYRRWERDSPMVLWQLDIVGGILIRDRNGSPVEAKIVTGVDDHSRFCVIATVVVRATGRAVCLAFAEALRRFGIPDEVLSDNGKQFTARFGRGGEVLFDRICRDNGIAHRLTQPASPTTTGKVERFHLTLRRELLDAGEIFDTVADAQAALDAWVHHYNTERPHQALDMATPASRFVDRTAGGDGQDLLPLRLPAILEPVTATTAAPTTNTPEPEPPEPEPAPGPGPGLGRWDGGPVEFERVVPASGNLFVANRQFWLGPAKAGLTVTFWADCDAIHLLIAGTRVKTLRSHLTPADLAGLVAKGARPAGPSPIPGGDETAIEVDRTVTTAGTVSIAGHHVTVGESHAGRRVGVRLETATVSFFDPDTRQLLRARPNPITMDEATRIRGARTAGPPPRPPVEPVTVQRRASATGLITVCGQKIALGRTHAGAQVLVHVAETTLTVEVGDDVRTLRRTTTNPVVQRKGQRPRKVPNVS
jgi:transposase InsO family protein